MKHHTTCYDKIVEAQEMMSKAERFLNKGLEDKTLMRLNDGSIRPRYCQFCVENQGHNVVPTIQSFQFNLSERDLEVIKNAGKTEWDHFWRDVCSELNQNGYDTSRHGFLPPVLTNERQYACFCDCCGLCSGWYLTQKDAMNEFDRISQEQIEYLWEAEADDE